jgi:hypothetical protein
MMAEEFNKNEIRFIRDVLEIYRNMLKKLDILIDINNADNETNLIFCNRILKKKSLLRLELAEWRFISDMLENYYEVLKKKDNISDYRTDSDDRFDIWFSISECDKLLVKIDQYI